MDNFNIINFLGLICIAIIFTDLGYRILKKINHYDINSMNISKSKNIICSLGIVFIINFFIFSYYFFIEKKYIQILPYRFYIFFGSILILSLISFWDDIKEIDPKVRLIIQLVLVYFSITNLNLQNLHYPFKLVIFFTLIFWVYIINITNFIDGSDGHCAIHCISFFIGIFFICNFFQIENFSKYLAFVNLINLLVFLIFNKPMAKAYMGDTGSIYLGYSIGFIILENIFLFRDIKIIYILSLFLYPILDCTITLSKKMYRGYYPWAKKGDYFFLIPIKNGQNHKKVFYVSIVYNVLNLLLVFLQINYSIFFFILNFISTLSLIFYFNSFKYEK